MKKIIIEVDSEEDNERIRNFVERDIVKWISENFKNFKKARVYIEDKNAN